MADNIIFRGNTTFSNELTVTGAFDVNGTFLVGTDGAVSGLTTIGSSGLATLGSISCDTGLIVSDGMGVMTVASISDGTATFGPSGGLSGVDSLETTGAITSGGDLTCGTFVVNQMDGSFACGSTGAEFAIDTNGSLSVAGMEIMDATTGDMKNITTITSSGAIAGGSLSDGTASLENGSITSAVNGTFSGIVSSAQLKVNQSSTISSDGSTYTQASNAPDNGSCIIQVTCNTDDDACGVWICTKTSGNAGVLSKIGGTVGGVSTYGLVGQWSDMEKPSFKYATSWAGGTTDVPFKATILGC